MTLDEAHAFLGPEVVAAFLARLGPPPPLNPAQLEEVLGVLDAIDAREAEVARDVA